MNIHVTRKKEKKILAVFPGQDNVWCMSMPLSTAAVTDWLLCSVLVLISLTGHVIVNWCFRQESMTLLSVRSVDMTKSVLLSQW